MGPTSPNVPETPGRGPVELFVTEPLRPPGFDAFRMLVDGAVELRPRRLVIDLAGCSGIDVVAIEFLVNVHRRLWQAGGRLVLRGPSPAMRRMFDLARVDHVLHIVPVERVESASRLR